MGEAQNPGPFRNALQVSVTTRHFALGERDFVSLVLPFFLKRKKPFGRIHAWTPGVRTRTGNPSLSVRVRRVTATSTPCFGTQRGLRPRSNHLLFLGWRGLEVNHDVSISRPGRSFRLKDSVRPSKLRRMFLAGLCRLR